MTQFQEFLSQLHTETQHGWTWGAACKLLGISPERTAQMPADELVKSDGQWYVNRQGLRRMLAWSVTRTGKMWCERILTEESDSYKVFYEAYRYEDTCIRRLEDERWEEAVLTMFEKEAREGRDKTISRIEWYRLGVDTLGRSLMGHRARRARLAREAGLPWQAVDDLEPIKSILLRLESRKANDLPLITDKSGGFKSAKLVEQEAQYDRSVEDAAQEFMQGKGSTNVDADAPIVHFQAKAEQRKDNRVRNTMGPDEVF